MLWERVPHVIERLRIMVSPQRLGNPIKYIVLNLIACGIERVPDQLNLLLPALRSVLLALQGVHNLGYAHRDVRWPNVLYVSDEDWRLIDFENSSLGDSEFMNNDMRMVGEMMSYCNSLVSTSDILASLRDKLLSEAPPDASEALAILARVSIPCPLIQL